MFSAPPVAAADARVLLPDRLFGRLFGRLLGRLWCEAVVLCAGASALGAVVAEKVTERRVGEREPAAVDGVDGTEAVVVGEDGVGVVGSWWEVGWVSALPRRCRSGHARSGGGEGGGREVVGSAIRWGGVGVGRKDEVRGGGTKGWAGLGWSEESRWGKTVGWPERRDERGARWRG